MSVWQATQGRSAWTLDFVLGGIDEEAAACVGFQVRLSMASEASGVGIVRGLLLRARGGKRQGNGKNSEAAR